MSVTIQSEYNVRTTGMYSNRRGLAPRKGATKSIRGHVRIPTSMRVLYISDEHRTGAWLAEAFASDSSSRIELHEAHGSTNGLIALRENVFDAVIVSHVPNELDAPNLIAGYRSGGINAATIVVGDLPDSEMKSRCFQVGADDYLCIHSTTVRNLLWTMSRAMKRFALEEENIRLVKEQDQIQSREQEEAQKILSEQKTTCGDIFNLCYQRENQYTGQVPNKKTAPKEFIQWYKDILKTYVIMGVGSLPKEVLSLVQVLVENNISAPEVIEVHLKALDGLIEKNGGRSTRHLMARADQLLVEFLTHLSEYYRLNYQVQR